MIIRELTSGCLISASRGGIHKEGNERVGINTQRYTESEDRPCRPLGLRDGAQAEQQGLLDGEGQRD